MPLFPNGKLFPHIRPQDTEEVRGLLSKTARILIRSATGNEGDEECQGLVATYLAQKSLGKLGEYHFHEIAEAPARADAGVLAKVRKILADAGMENQKYGDGPLADFIANHPILVKILLKYGLPLLLALIGL